MRLSSIFRNGVGHRPCFDVLDCDGQTMARFHFATDKEASRAYDAMREALALCSATESGESLEIFYRYFGSQAEVTGEYEDA